ncbi:MAG TPA: hypothetical protein VLV16_04560 [Gemmatimonadales bacterium]|nr:hypothetical protein [Gemmatimonadales bacterium]
MLFRIAVALSAALVVASPRRGSAQVRLEIGPAIGAYRPGGPAIEGCSLKSSASWRCGASSASSYTQTGAAAVGARITVSPWDRGATAGRLAFQGSFSYVPSQYVSSESLPGFEPIDGTILVADLRVAVRMALGSPAVSGLLMGGPALIHSDLTHSTSVGGAVGGGIDVHLGRVFVLRADAVEYLYSLDLESDYLRFAGGDNSRHDLAVSIAISARTGR